MHGPMNVKFINSCITFSELPDLFLEVPQWKRGSHLIFGAALYLGCYGNKNIGIVNTLL